VFITVSPLVMLLCRPGLPYRLREGVSTGAGSGRFAPSRCRPPASSRLDARAGSFTRPGAAHCRTV